MVSYWLVKQEPSSYAWRDLEKEKETEWNGVHNALALRHLRTMVVGDLAMVYHSGTERSAVGIARVVRDPRPDPDDARGSWTVRVRAVRPLRRPVTLAEIRADPGFAGFELLRFSRLSVLPVSGDHWARLIAREQTSPSAAGPLRGRSSGPGKTSASPPRGRGARHRR